MLTTHHSQIRPSNGSTLLVCLDLNRKIKSVNGPLIHLLIYDEADIIGLDFSTLVVEQDFSSFETLFNPKVDRSEFGIYRPDGSVLFADVLVFDLVDENERIVGYCLRIYDITARMQQINELFEIERGFREILDQVNDVVCIFRKSRLIYSNKKASMVSGHIGESLHGTEITHFFQPSDYELLLDGMNQLSVSNDNQVTIEASWLNSMGLGIPCKITLKKVNYAGAQALMLVAGIKGNAWVDKQNSDHKYKFV